MAEGIKHQNRDIEHAIKYGIALCIDKVQNKNGKGVNKMNEGIRYIPGTEEGHHYLVVFDNGSYTIGIRALGGPDYRVRIIANEDGEGNVADLSCIGDFTLKGDHISAVCSDVVRGIETAAEIIGAK